VTREVDNVWPDRALASKRPRQILHTSQNGPRRSLGKCHRRSEAFRLPVCPRKVTLPLVHGMFLVGVGSRGNLPMRRGQRTSGASAWSYPTLTAPSPLSPPPRGGRGTPASIAMARP
jgi:hypothetical protein